MNTKYLLVSILAAGLCLGAAAIPARREAVPYVLPDGTTILIRNHGDEFCHYTTDLNGNVIELGSDGFFHPGKRPSKPERMLSAARRRAAAQERKKTRTRAEADDFPMTHGARRIPVLLVNFSDKSFIIDNPRESFDNLLNQEGYSAHGGTGSVRDFYLDNSHGAFDPSFDVYGPFTLPSKMSTYGPNDDAALAIFQAATGLDDEIDFSRYDSDGDGNVDMLLLYYAGLNQASNSFNNNLIWPHQWLMDYSDNSQVAGNRFDGVHISKYFCTSELKGSSATNKNNMDGIGTTCHEFAHSLGLPDFYDTDYDEANDEAGAVYAFSTMCDGAYNNDGCTPPWFTIEERMMLGWADAPAFLPESGDVTLGPVSDNLAYRSATSMENEYFVYECRDGKGWDAPLPTGLVVYHIDKSDRTIQISVPNDWGGYYSVNITPSELWSDWESYNCINENAAHPCYYVIPSTDQTRLEISWDLSGSPEKIIFPGSGNTTEYTPKDWNGTDAPFTLENIRFDGERVRFTLPFYDLAYFGHNSIDVPATCAPGAELALRLLESERRPVSAVAWYLDDEPVSLTSIVLTEGTHLLEARVTLADGRKEILEKTIHVE